MEGRLEAIADAKEQVDGTDSVGSNSDSLHIAVGFKVKGDNSRRKDTPVNGIVQGLFDGESKARVGCAQRRDGRRRLRARDSRQQAAAENGKQSVTPNQIQYSQCAKLPRSTPEINSQRKRGIDRHRTYQCIVLAVFSIQVMRK